VECFLQAARGLRSLRKGDEFGLREDEIEPKASSLGGGRKWAFRRQNPVKSFLAYFEDYFCPAVSLRGELSRPGQSWIEAVLPELRERRDTRAIAQVDAEHPRGCQEVRTWIRTHQRG